MLDSSLSPNMTTGNKPTPLLLLSFEEQKFFKTKFSKEMDKLAGFMSQAGPLVDKLSKKIFL